MTTMMNKTYRSFTPARHKVGLALVLLGGLAGAGSIGASAQDNATAQAAAPAGERTDGQIEMDVVHQLDAAQELKQDWITAGTVQGEVTLSGTSASDANRQLAESIASKVPGVTKVVNNLKVGDPQTAAQQNGAQPQDQQDQQYATDGQGQDQGQVQPAAGNDNMPPQPQPGYPPQPGYQQGPGYQQQGPRQNYAPAQGPALSNVPPSRPVTLPQGTLLKVRTSESLNSKMAKDGTPVEFTVVRDVYAAGVLAIPRGAVIHGVVTDVKKSGALGGRAGIGLNLQTLDLGGKSYAIASDPFEVQSPNKAGRTVGNAFGGAVLGAIIGGAVGGGGGAAIGAGAGAVGGTAASAATPGPRVWIPSEALMDFHLNAPLTVAPVSPAEAQRMAANAGPAPQDRPTLYRRGPYPYGYPPPPPPPPGYYYRPY